jgi:hypothetical protein
MLVSLSSGRIEEATVRAVIQQRDETRKWIMGKMRPPWSTYGRSVVKIAESDAVVATLPAPPERRSSKFQAQVVIAGLHSAFAFLCSRLGP